MQASKAPKRPRRAEDRRKKQQLQDELKMLLEREKISSRLLLGRDEPPPDHPGNCSPLDSMPDYAHIAFVLHSTLAQSTQGLLTPKPLNKKLAPLEKALAISYLF